MSKVQLLEPSLHHYGCTDFYASKYDGSSPLPSMICTSCTNLRRHINTARKRGKLPGTHDKTTRKLYLDGLSVKDGLTSENGVALNVITEPESAVQSPVRFVAVYTCNYV